MTFNGLAYGLCFVWSGLSVALHFVDFRWRRRAHHEDNAEFVGFQRRYLVGYLPLLFADSLQAPYLYYLYQSYGFLESQIAMLYVVGFLTAIVASMASVWLVQRTERKMLCLVFVGLNSVSCLMKFSESYGVLMISRVLDGLAGSLLSAPFQEWYVDEHIRRFDFPQEWIPLTFRKVGVVHGYLAVGAGLLAESSENAFRMTAFPFLLAIPALLAGGFAIASAWGQSRLDKAARPKFWAQFARGLGVMGSNPNVFLLSGVQALFEAAIAMLAFVWTPLFMGLKPLLSQRPSFGGIYAAFMAALLFGTVLQRILGRRLSAIALLNVAGSLGFVALSLVVLLAWPSGAPWTVTRFQVLLLGLCSFQTAVGLYFPSVARLHKEILPREDRAAILGLFRIPVNALAAAGLLVLHSKEKEMGNWLILLTACGLLGAAALAGLGLHSLLRRPTNPQRGLHHLTSALATFEDDDAI